MSTDVRDRSLGALSDVGQKHLADFGAADTEKRFMLHCESCGQAVGIGGERDDAAYAADRHLDSRIACRRVAVTDRDNNEATVFVADVPSWAGDQA